MVEIINCIILNVTTDLMLLFCLKKFFKLKVRVLEILFLEIVMVAPAVVYVLCNIMLAQFVILKLIAGVLVCLLITDSFSFCFLSKLFGLYIVFFFSIFGVNNFMVEFVKTVASMVFNITIPYFFDFVVLVGVIVYVVMIFVLVRGLSKFNTLKNYLANVSFMFMGKHIQIVGLYDTGNTLIDDVTHKPVVIVSSDALKKYFADINFEKDFVCDRCVECVSAGEACFSVPVYDVGEICIKQGGEIKCERCVLGFVERGFYDDKNYQCLLHRDFV